MLVKELINKLEEMDGEHALTIDSDNNGFWELLGLEIRYDKEDGSEYVNIVSSNEV